MKHYTIYKVTNRINNKIYIGKHITNNPKDSYLGSGVLLNKDIKLYGKESFDKVILFNFDNEHDMNEKEKEIVSLEFCNREDTYNSDIGGRGSYEKCNQSLTVDDRKRINNSAEKAKISLGNEFNRRISKGLQLFISRLTSEEKVKLYSRKFSDETKLKMSISQKKRLQNQTVWNQNKVCLYNKETKENLYVDKDKVNEFLNDKNWIKGKFNQETYRKYVERIKNKEDKKKQKVFIDNNRIQNRIDELTPMYQDYIQYGFQYVCSKYNYTKSRENLTAMFKTYLPEYDSKLLYITRKKSKPFLIPEGKSKVEYYTEMYQYYRLHSFNEMCLKYNYTKSKNNFLTQCKIYVSNYQSELGKNQFS